MLSVVDGKLMNSREMGNAVAKLLLEGHPIDMICEIEGMPTPGQIAFMRRHDADFGEALHTAFEGAGIEAAFVLMKGARDGKIGKNQVDAAQWVAERMAPDLFQERKTITNEVIKLSDDEIAFQLQAAARSDERVRRLLKSGILEGEVANGGATQTDEDQGHTPGGAAGRGSEQDASEPTADPNLIRLPSPSAKLTPHGVRKQLRRYATQPRAGKRHRSDV